MIATRGAIVAAVAATVVSAGSASAAAADSAWTVKTLDSDGHFASVSSDGTNTWAFGDHNGKAFAAKRLASGGWHEYSTPDIGSAVHGLTRANNDAWAVGDAYQTGSSTIHWNGSKWSSVSVPESNNISTDAIAKIGNQTWAAGIADYENQHGYVIRTSGTKWTDAKLPTGMFTDIKGMSGTSPSDVWVVGSTTDWDTDSTVPVAAHWNGTAWKKTTLPTTKYEIIDVVDTKANDVRAVGYRTEDSHGNKVHDTVSLHWNGTKWTKSIPYAGKGVAPKAIDKVGNETWIVGRTVSDNKAAVLRLDSTAWKRLADVPEYTSSDVTSLSGGRPILVGSTPASDDETPHPTAALRGS